MVLMAPETPIVTILRQGGSTGISLIGGPFTLVDHNGQTRQDSEFRGQLMLIYFGFTYCPDACPTTLQAVSDALDMIGPAAAARVQPLLITIDPARDTPEKLNYAIMALFTGRIAKAVELLLK